MEPRIQTALYAAELRCLKHYCPEAAERGMQNLGNILADRIEIYDSTITPTEFKNELESALREWDQQDYDLREEGILVPMTRLYTLEVVLHEILPQIFTEELRSAYGI